MSLLRVLVISGVLVCNAMQWEPGMATTHKIMDAVAGRLTQLSAGGIAPLSEVGYQMVVNRGDEEMKAFVRRLIEQHKGTIVNEGSLSGFVPYYSGTESVQDFRTLLVDLKNADWVQGMSGGADAAKAASFWAAAQQLAKRNTEQAADAGPVAKAQQPVKQRAADQAADASPVAKVATQMPTVAQCCHRDPGSTDPVQCEEWCRQDAICSFFTVSAKEDSCILCSGCGSNLSRLQSAEEMKGFVLKVIAAGWGHVSNAESMDLFVKRQWQASSPWRIGSLVHALKYASWLEDFSAVKAMAAFEEVNGGDKISARNTSSRSSTVATGSSKTSPTRYRTKALEVAAQPRHPPGAKAADASDAITDKKGDHARGSKGESSKTKGSSAIPAKVTSTASTKVTSTASAKELSTPLTAKPDNSPIAGEASSGVSAPSAGSKGESSKTKESSASPANVTSTASAKVTSTASAKVLSAPFAAKPDNSSEAAEASSGYAAPFAGSKGDSSKTKESTTVSAKVPSMPSAKVPPTFSTGHAVNVAKTEETSSVVSAAAAGSNGAKESSMVSAEASSTASAGVSTGSTGKAKVGAKPPMFTPPELWPGLSGNKGEGSKVKVSSTAGSGESSAVLSTAPMANQSESTKAKEPSTNSTNVSSTSSAKTPWLVSAAKVGGGAHAEESSSARSVKLGSGSPERVSEGLDAKESLTTSADKQGELSGTREAAAPEGGGSEEDGAGAYQKRLEAPVATRFDNGTVVYTDEAGLTTILQESDLIKGMTPPFWTHKIMVCCPDTAVAL